MAHDHGPGGAGLDGWLACDRCGAVVPPAAESEVAAGLNLGVGSPCPLCALAGKSARALRPARVQDILRRAGEG